MSAHIHDSIEEHAIVVAVHGHQAELEIERKQACGLCGKTRGCGVSLVGKALGHHGTVKVDNTLNASVGQHVLLRMHPSYLLRGTAILYGAPLLGLILGALCGKLIFNQVDTDAISTSGVEILGALVGLILSQWWMHRYRIGSSAAYAPELVKVVDYSVINFSCERSQ